MSLIIALIWHTINNYCS